jgi:hypothetical protein
MRLFGLPDIWENLIFVWLVGFLLIEDNKKIWRQDYTWNECGNNMSFGIRKLF